MAVQEAPSPARAPSAPRDDVQPVANETADRIATGTITVVPIIALFVVAWQLWDRALRPSDLVIFAVLYLATGLGITVGFHRLFTHRSFETKPWVRGMLAIMGSMAIEGPIVSWVADHRKHHAFADQEGDPHSPHVDHGVGFKGALRGLFHAHVGWLFIHDQRALRTRYAPDLLADPVVAWVDRRFLVWALGGLALPFVLGLAVTGTVSGGLTALLWGGAVRLLVLHHATYSINSICHVFGRRRFPTDDKSRNVRWLALLTFGEAWHNNHHAFPTSAEHGLRRTEIDISAWVIRLLEKAGLAWNVTRIAPERQAAKEARGPAR